MTHVEARSAQMLAPDELIARLSASHDYGKVSAITLTSDRSAAVRIRFARSEGGAGPSSVYVDPYDGHLLGTPRGEDFFATVRRLHRWLLLPGDANGYGRQITGVVALGLIVLLISGIVLRWPRRAGSVKMWLKPSLALRGRGFHRSLHSVAGTWVLVIVLSGHGAHRPLVFVRLVQEWRHLAAVASFNGRWTDADKITARRRRGRRRASGT